MDDTFVLDQVERGKIVAQIDRSGEGIQRILLSEDPAGLRAFIHRAGARAFDLENPLPCRRVKPSVAQE
jgi:hypothetical protein